MKRFLALLILAGITYGGYLFYLQTTHTPSTTNSLNLEPKKLILTQTSDRLGSLAAVLGTSISDTLDNGKELLKDATGGASEPIINQLIAKTQETLKDLPQKEAEKIKYEFCKGVIEEYENK